VTVVVGQGKEAPTDREQRGRRAGLEGARVAPTDRQHRRRAGVARTAKEPMARAWQTADGAGVTNSRRRGRAGTAFLFAVPACP